MRTPPPVQFQFPAKILPNSRFVLQTQGLALAVWEILDPPLQNVYIYTEKNYAVKAMVVMTTYCVTEPGNGMECYPPSLHQSPPPHPHHSHRRTNTITIIQSPAQDSQYTQIDVKRGWFALSDASMAHHNKHKITTTTTLQQHVNNASYINTLTSSLRNTTRYVCDCASIVERSIVQLALYLPIYGNIPSVHHKQGSL